MPRIDPAAELFPAIGLICRNDECGWEVSGITQDEATAEGWRNIEPVEHDPRDAWAWWDHVGTCPSCAKENP